MSERLNAFRVAVCGAICLLALGSLPLAAVTALGCDDCREIKGLPVATPHPARPNAAASPAAIVVRAVLYWAEGCGHCHEVLDGILPQMQERYGPQLAVRLVEVVTLEDLAAFYDVAEGYGYARGRASVPFLLIGERALLSAERITTELPGLIETCLADGGADWPDLTVIRSAPRPTAAATESGSCGFAAPCPAAPAAGSEASATGGMPSRAAPASAVVALGLVAVTGGGLVAFLRRRAIGRRARASAPNADTSLPVNGDNDAT